MFDRQFTLSPDWKTEDGDDRLIPRWWVGGHDLDIDWDRPLYKMFGGEEVKVRVTSFPHSGAIGLRLWFPRITRNRPDNVESLYVCHSSWVKVMLHPVVDTIWISELPAPPSIPS